ncbi:hypothetical protein CY34DRAFT_446825 [Suillus luteus UH-Slu-Lm8-n1]|uniref:Unplaced genomic scaffold CY34scaffold_307, whole genome shotgun sequence n=1 Tax=Suillus luteus UH-Slu-Lm8-n1 TaxID=930992 RepID=A0A0D0ATP9_9AGAM|nr:hypothetical protein CY34DRAFT_446825 [Suillus luteus UH-Slu-Lm8-n1]
MTHKRDTEGNGRSIEEKRENNTSSGAAPNSARIRQKCNSRHLTASERVRFFGTKAEGSWRAASITTDAGKSVREVAEHQCQPSEGTQWSRWKGRKYNGDNCEGIKYKCYLTGCRKWTLGQYHMKQEV